MALERFWWGPSLDLLWESRNGALWLEHCKRVQFLSKMVYKRVRGWTMGHGTETPPPPLPQPYIRYYSNLGAVLISKQSQRPRGCLLISCGRYKMQVTGQITSAG